MQTSRLFGVVIIALLILSFSVKGQGTAVVSIAQPTIEIKKSLFYINGIPIQLPIPAAELERIIGKSDRSMEGIRKVSTWDKLGLIGYQKVGSEDFIEIGVILNVAENTFDFMPGSTYTGLLTVDGAKVTANSTRDTVNQKKSGGKFKPIPLVGMLSDYKTGDFYLVMWQKEAPRASRSGKILQINVAIAP
ncbi:hypothetical protein BH10ACI2_BH10ACI2_25010 [soil metagenome]